MEWWVVFTIISTLLIAFFVSGIPVAFAFLSLNIIGFVSWMGGTKSLELLVPAAFNSVGVFTLAAVPLFILMGEALMHSGIARMVIDNLGKWVGRLPGSLSLLAIASGTLFAMMSGSAVSGVALFGATLCPEMERRGYKKPMIYVPILAAGGLAVMIPPSVTAVVVASLSQQSAGKLLMAGVIPGFTLAGFYVIYILLRGWLQPHLAPSFAPPHVSWGERVKALSVMAPVGLIIFLVLGTIFLGVATPSEAAALGAVGAFILAAAYRKLTWSVARESLWATISVTAMVFMIVISASAFSNLLAFTGVIRKLSEVAINLPVAPIFVVVIMQILMIVMGMFIDDFSLAMISIPIFFPVIKSIGIDPLWFAFLIMVNMQLASVTPPFGMGLFTLKGVVPNATMGDIYRAGGVCALLKATILAAVMIFPPIAMWLPGLMMK